jgi:hypothetical protein
MRSRVKSRWSVSRSTPMFAAMAQMLSSVSAASRRSARRAGSAGKKLCEVT